MPEHDPLTARLAALAPSVDVAASRELFERRRLRPAAGRRWLLPAAVTALLIAGVVGVWAFARSEQRGTAPITSVDEPPADDDDNDVPTASTIGDNFELLTISQTTRLGGTVEIATTVEERNRALDNLSAERVDVTVDLTRSIMVVLNVDQSSCPLILEGFDVADTVWTPRFLTSLQLCEEIGLTWAYVVAIERDDVGSSVTVRLPPEFGGGEATVDLDIDRPTSDGPTPGAILDPALTPTGVRVPLPPVGEPRIAIGTFGVVWVVQHEDGAVSVLDAVVDRPPDADADGGVSGLGDLVSVSIGGDAFSTASSSWDEWGRAVNRPRTADLAGFSGRLVDGEVEVLLSDVARIAGDPAPSGEPAFDPPDLSGVPLLDLDQLATLSFSGPIWRLLDATLVVQDGIGSLCSIDPAVPVPDLATCEGTGVRTAVRSTQPDITRWFFGPLLTEFDEVGQIVTVAPLGGETSRDDGPDDSASEAPSADGWRELARVEGGGFEGFPTLVVDDARYAELGETIGTSTLAPVDFDTSVVIAFVTTSSPCLTPLATPFSPTGDWIEPRFEPATETACRLSLVSYTFVIEIDRGRLGETVRLVVPERVDSLDSSRDRTVDDITYRIDDGALVAGGLRIGDGISADCRDPGGPVLSVPVTSVDSRSFSLEFRIDGRVVWEVGGSGAPLTVGGGLDLSLLSAEPGEIVASSTDPPAEFRRPFELSQEEIDQLIAECGPTAPTGVAAGPGWRLLSESWNTELTGLPHLAVDDSSLAELGNDAGPLDVDLDEQFVVAVSVFGNSCPPVVAGVDVEAGRVAVRFKRSPAVTCDDVGIVYGFLVAVDRVATGDIVQVSATDPAGLSAAHETTFDVRSGDLLEGGLAFQQFEPVFVDCSEVAGELDLIVPLETVIEREVVVVVHDTDGAPLATRSIALTTGRSEVRVPVPGDLAGDLAIGVTATDPAAQLERTVTLTATDIADSTRRCTE